MRLAGLIAVVLSLRAPAAARQTEPPAMFPAQMARMYPFGNEGVWVEAVKVLEDAGLQAETFNRTAQFLVTRPEKVDKKRLGVDPKKTVTGAESARLQLHVFVSPFSEPARVYVGSVVTVVRREVVSPATRRNSVATFYNAEPFGLWFLQKLSERLGTVGQLVPQDSSRRAALARALLPAQTNACLSKIEQTTVDGAAGQPATKIHDEPLILPTDAQSGRDRRRLTVEAVIGEDGFLWPLRIISGAAATDQFGSAAYGAMSLWRFSPARYGDCPTPVVTTVTLGFGLY